MSDPPTVTAGHGSADEPLPANAAGQTKHRRPGRTRRFFIAAGVTVVLVLGLAGIGGALLIRRYDNAVAKDTLLAPSARAEAPRATVVGPLNFLLIGSDYRTWSPDAGQRSDTIIIAHLSQALDHVYLISVPRDLLVELPAVPELNFPGATTKINAAFDYGRGGRGGVQLLSQTLTNLMGIRFDGAAVIDFSGLQKAVDILGGVEVCVDVRVVSVHTRKVFEPGCRMMGSKDVLDYLRQRNFPDGDFSRQRHQQQFLKAFFDRAVSMGMFTNPLKLDALLRAVAGSMTVDTGANSLPDLVFALRDLRPGDMTGVKIPATLGVIDTVSYVIASADAEGLFVAIRTDALSAWVSTHPQWVNRI